MRKNIYAERKGEKARDERKRASERARAKKGPRKRERARNGEKRREDDRQTCALIDIDVDCIWKVN